MTQLAFIFPGQGSQQVGMGAELARAYPIANTVFQEADAALGRALSQLCFEGPEEALKQTENTQLAILTCSVATLRILKELGITPNAVAGHSLGEYSALVAAGVLDFADALRLVHARASLMAEAGETQQGTMAAILGMEIEQLRELCDGTEGTVNIANYNCPGQLVISGEVDAVNHVVSLAKVEIGERRCRLLPVSGAFHSPLMAPAQQKFRSALDSVTLYPPQVDIVMNVTGEFVKDVEDIRHLLFQQITQPVQWEKTLRTIEKAGITHFVEVGPGKVLSGLVKRTLPESSTVNVEDIKTLSVVADEHGNGG
ncbi:Malonyl CoA-acyl carrier protein transacylase [Geodia barretti]|uniref:[acyl-carrier-protein] S-malonyltransferase n=1 Tax=Geodia barretti TaxID=519541 RepID=A0AA35RM82_GEOBA|nr:Malonyl CoA-acyl carrier protein transacylase [Geodia barretti]